MFSNNNIHTHVYFREWARCGFSFCGARDHSEPKTRASCCHKQKVVTCILDRAAFGVKKIIPAVNTLSANFLLKSDLRAKQLKYVKKLMAFLRFNDNRI